MDGIPEEINEVWENAIKSLEQKGAIIKNISLPHTKYALPTYYIIAPAEASSNLARYDGVKYGYRTEEARSLDEMYELTRSEGFGKEVKRRNPNEILFTHDLTIEIKNVKKPAIVCEWLNLSIF